MMGDQSAESTNRVYVHLSPVDGQITAGLIGMAIFDIDAREEALRQRKLSLAPQD